LSQRVDLKTLVQIFHADEKSVAAPDIFVA
jgi:hypothetical protein